MDFFNTAAGIIATIAATLSAIAGIIALIRKPFLIWQEKRQAERKAKEDVSSSLCGLKEVTEKLFQQITLLSTENSAQNRVFQQLLLALTELKRTMDENEIDRIRWEILTFANMCRRQVRNTKDEFVHIINLYHKYHALLEAQGRENGQITMEFAYISKLFMKLSEEDGFAKD